MMRSSIIIRTRGCLALLLVDGGQRSAGLQGASAGGDQIQQELGGFIMRNKQTFTCWARYVT